MAFECNWCGDGVELWTRGEEPISGQPNWRAEALPEGTVLDGELLLWSEGHPKSFAELQTRLHRAPRRKPNLTFLKPRSQS